MCRELHRGTGGTSTALAQKVKDAPALITLRKMRVTSDTDDAGYSSKKTLDSCIQATQQYRRKSITNYSQMLLETTA